MNFSNSYIDLGDAFYQVIAPIPVRDPKLLLWNSPLAESLGVDPGLSDDTSKLAQHFSGNETLPGSQPIAAAYAGHQFGHFNPQLGDGRAHLLGEVLSPSGGRWDIQLKGSGITQFSRGGDGRCAIGPAVREFIMSEAMFALGIPTTRCLAVVTTGEAVYREFPLPGAVVTRVASSHIRVGTFEYFAARGDMASLQALAEYAIERHYPDITADGPDRYIALLEAVINRLTTLVVDWMRVGFIHGVMNTDNTAISGETIDYGPCAMMGVYHPETVYSSIDTMGRYAFGNQPKILHWNMARFAETLLPLIDRDPDTAVSRIEHLISGFPEAFNRQHLNMLSNKMGLNLVEPGTDTLVYKILDEMEQQRLDYTITFDRFTQSLSSEQVKQVVLEQFGETATDWYQRLELQDASLQQTQALMRSNNPTVIPRNHHVETVLRQCEVTGDASHAQTLIQVLKTPYEMKEHTADYQDPPADGDLHYQTFCGT